MNDAEELWQAYELNGQPAGPITRARAGEGGLHGASHVWIWRRVEGRPEILVQQRAKDKRTWPGYVDISAAGHIAFDETPLIAAIRETREEIGVEIGASGLELLFVHHAHLVAPGMGIIENEFQFVYGCELPGDTELSFTDGEVGAVLWLPLTDFHALCADGLGQYRIVPHGEVYFANLMAGLARASGTDDHHGD